LNQKLGDAIMCLFNAPLPLENHALMAVSTALQMNHQISVLNDIWKSSSLPSLQIRIGINSDVCLIGNIGSNDRMNYTALGDAVNIASRCECLNKRYDTSISITEKTYEHVKNSVLCNWITYVSFKGKTNPIHVYEPICFKETASDKQIISSELHERMKECLMNHNYAQLTECCNSLLVMNSNDLSAQEMKSRIDLIQSGQSTINLILCDK
jgi:adenylate cyclase